jgi:hypothetical protein
MTQFQKGHAPSNKKKTPEDQLSDTLSKGNAAEREAMKTIMVKHMKKNIKPVLDAVTKRALGLKMLRRTGAGREEVYTQEPNIDAAKVLIEHAVGKPKEALEVTEKRTIFIDC